jgi:hypothetical protein
MSMPPIAIGDVRLVLSSSTFPSQALLLLATIYFITEHDRTALSLSLSLPWILFERIWVQTGYPHPPPFPFCYNCVNDGSQKSHTQICMHACIEERTQLSGTSILTHEKRNKSSPDSEQGQQQGHGKCTCARLLAIFLLSRPLFPLLSNLLFRHNMLSEGGCRVYIASFYSCQAATSITCVNHNLAP